MVMLPISGQNARAWYVCGTKSLGWPLLPQQEGGATLEEVFRYFDADRDGLLALNEMEEGLRTIGATQVGKWEVRVNIVPLRVLCHTSQRTFVKP
jgi:hypothetical protein